MRRAARQSPRAPDEEDVTRPDDAAYLYCVVRSARAPRMGRVPDGLPGAGMPAAIEAGVSTWLILANVPLSKYGPEALESKLRDLDLVAELAVAHESVVEFFARSSGVTVVPMKMFTMFSSVERAVDEMRARRREIGRALDRVEGCEEWGVRVTARAPRVVRMASERPVTGTAFLTARKHARDETQKALRKSVDAAELALKELSALANESRQRRDAPPGAVAPLLDAAFLVPSRSRAKFRTTAKRLARRCAQSGAALTLTGPWPAYNFVQDAGD